MQRVAKTYFTPTNRVVLHDHAAGHGRATDASRGSWLWLGGVRRRAGPDSSRCAVQLASESAPRPLAAEEVKFRHRDPHAPNGLQVMAILHHEQPAVTMRLLVARGAAQDPEGNAASPSSSRTCSTRAPTPAARSRSPSRSTSSAERWAPGPAPT